MLSDIFGAWHYTRLHNTQCNMAPVTMPTQWQLDVADNKAEHQTIRHPLNPLDVEVTATVYAPFSMWHSFHATSSSADPRFPRFPRFANQPRH